MKNKRLFRKALLLLLSVLLSLPYAPLSISAETPGENEAPLNSVGDAQIGDTIYSTLPEAVAAVKANETITLLRDVELHEPLTVPKVTPVTIAGNNHTVYFGSDDALRVETGAPLYLITVTEGVTVTFTEVNFCGQTMAEPNGTLAFGSSGKKTAAIKVSGGSQKTTFRDCSFHGFYSRGLASVLHADSACTKPNAGAGIILENTIITGNKSLNATAEYQGCAVKCFSNASSSAQTATEITVSGSTVIYDNLDKNGNQGNVFTQNKGGSFNHANAGGCLIIESNFTGKVGAVGAWEETPATSSTGESFTLRPTFLFPEGWNGIGDAVCNTGSLAYPDDAGKGKLTTTEKFLTHTQNGNTGFAWTPQTSFQSALAAMTAECTAGEPRADAARESLLTVKTDTESGVMFSPQSGACFTVLGNGHTFRRNARNNAPMFRVDDSAGNGSYIRVENLILDGQSAVTAEPDGKLTFTTPTAGVPTYFSGANGGAFDIIGETATLELKNLTIENIAQGYNASDANITAYGAAIFIRDKAKAILDGVTVRNCASTSGAPINLYQMDCTVTLRGKCVFENNSGLIFEENAYRVRARADISGYRDGSKILIDDGYVGCLYTDGYTAGTVKVAKFIGTDSTTQHADFKTAVNERYPSELSVADSFFRLTPTAYLENAQVALGSDKLTMKIFAHIPADSHVRATVVGNERGVFAVESLETDGENVIIPVVVDMTEMTRAITIESGTLADGAFTASRDLTASLSTPLTVRHYMDLLLAGDYEETMKTAVRSTLNLGGYAQTYFSETDTALANAGIYTEAIPDPVPGDNFPALNAAVENNLPTANYGGFSLVLNGEISLRLYVKDCPDATFGVTYLENGTPKTEVCELKTGKYGSFIELSHISTSHLGDSVTFTVNDSRFSCSPMSYVNLVLAESDDECLKNVCKALYFYYASAASHFGFPNSVQVQE